MTRGLIHRFSAPLPLDYAKARRWLGSKGAGLAEMTMMGLPVPPGFTLSVELWKRWNQEGRLGDDVREAIDIELRHLEDLTGRRFGDPQSPLLLAVRSGAAVSMPGMLDTVLDVGINSEVATGLEAHYQSERFARDVERRFIECYAATVLGVPHEAFDAVMGVRRRELNQLDANQLAQMIEAYRALIRAEASTEVPQKPREQLFGSIEGVLASWKCDRAKRYRETHGIAEDLGTAVTIQAMVYGNLHNDSLAGVVFSRAPTDGSKQLFGEYLPNAQGEDVVSGRQTPLPLTKRQVRPGRNDQSLETYRPDLVAEIRTLAETLESHFGDAQDLEFTVERGTLYLLQCRRAKRSALAAAKIAVDLHEEGQLTQGEALLKIEEGTLRQLVTPQLPDPEWLSGRGIAPIARGLAASPGAAVGRILFDGKRVPELDPSEGLILVRAETSAEDVHVMRQVDGVLTTTGGLTCHAAVVARAMGKPCIVGASSLHVDYRAQRLIRREGTKTIELGEGDILTVDGYRGLVFPQAVAVELSATSPEAKTLLQWADLLREVQFWSIATSTRTAEVGRHFGADGIFVTPSLLPSSALRDALGDTPAMYQVLDKTALEAIRPFLRAGDALALDFVLDPDTASEIREAKVRLGNREPQLCRPEDFLRNCPSDPPHPDVPTVWDAGTPMTRLNAEDGLLCSPLDLPTLRLQAGQYVAKRQSGYFRRPGINA